MDAEPHRSVGSTADLRTGDRWFDPGLSQYSFRGLMIVIWTGFFLLSPLSVISTMVMWELKQPVAWKDNCAEYWLKELKESMDRCTGRCNISEILLKTALNTIQTNKSMHGSLSQGLTLSQTSPGFYLSTVQVFRKHWEKEKLLLVKFRLFINFEIIICKLFLFGPVYNIVIWERVSIIHLKSSTCF